MLGGGAVDAVTTPRLARSRRASSTLRSPSAPGFGYPHATAPLQRSAESSQLIRPDTLVETFRHSMEHN